MNKLYFLAIAVLAFWVGAGTSARASFIPPGLPFDKTPPKYTLPNNPHPSLEELVKGLEARSLQNPDDAEIWYQLGLAYSDELNYDRAVFALQKAVSLDSVHVLAWENLGINLYLNQQPEDALTALKKAVSLGSSDPEVWNSLGLILLGLNRLPESEDALSQGLKLTAHSRRLWNSLGLLREKEGKFDEAILAFRHATEIDPSYAIGWNNLGLVQKEMGNPEALISLQYAVHFDPKMGVAWENLAQVYINLTKFKEAEDAAEHARILLPNDPSSWLLLAQSARALQKWELTVECYHQAIDILGLKGSFITGDHDYALAYAEYGNACSNIFHYDDADKLLQKSLKIDPTSTTAWTAIGFLRSLQVRWQEAQIALQKSLELDPKQSDAWNSLGEVYLHGLDKPAEAEQAFQKSVTLLPTYSGAWYGLGRAQQLLQKRKEAAEAYRKATVLAPNWVLPWQQLAATALDPQESDQAIARAISLEPQNAKTYGIQGAILSQRQNWPEAEKALRQSLDLAKDDSGCWCMLSATLFKQQKYEEAAETEENAIKYGSQSSPAELATEWDCVASAHLAQVHAKGAPEWQAALTAINHATALNPTNSTYWYTTVLCDQALGHTNDATAAMAKWKEFGSLTPRIVGVNPDGTPSITPPPTKEAAMSDSLKEANAIRVLMHNNQFNDAFARAELQTTAHPQDPLAWYSLGDVLMNMKRYEEAIPCLNKSLALDPKMGASWFDLGNSLAYLGRFDEALDALTKSIDYMPNFPLNWEAFVQCYHVKGDFPTAKAKLDPIVHAHSDSGYGWGALGDVDVALGNFAAGQAELQKAVNLQPDYGHALNSLGLVDLTLQQKKLALDCFLKATTADAPDVEAWNNLGYTYFLLEQPDKAIEAYQQAIKSNSRDVLALYNLVTAYAAEKQWKLAHQACDNLAQINPAQAAQLQQRFPEMNSVETLHPAPAGP